VFQWLKKQGGLVRPLAHEHPVHPRGFEGRRRIPQRGGARGMVQLKGHRAVGGMRASMTGKTCFLGNCPNICVWLGFLIYTFYA